MDELFAGSALYSLMLVFCRAGGLLALAPVFTGQTAPVIVRVAMSFLLACILVGIVPSPGPAPAHFLWVVLAIGHEILVGLLMGMASRLVMFAIEMAGQMMATEIGLMMSSSLDPISHSETSPVGIALSTFAAVIFLISGAHHFMLLAFVRSFDLVPAALGNFDPRVADLVVRESGKIFLLAVEMASPLIAMNFLVHLALAILGRAAPSINAFLLSIPIQILAGLTLFGMIVGLTARHMLSGFGEIPELMLRFIH
jgi:flagellar biosynthesis protein FliR